MVLVQGRKNLKRSMYEIIFYDTIGVLQSGVTSELQQYDFLLSTSFHFLNSSYQLNLIRAY